MMEGQQPNVFMLIIMRWVEPQLRRTQRLLTQANVQLDKALKENLHLKNRNEELARHVERLESDNGELHRAIKTLREANKVQVEMMDRMERSQKDLMDRVERLVGRVMQLEVQLGNTPKLPIE
jgi:predicted nuclease with TOPRIM domain